MKSNGENALTVSLKFDLNLSRRLRALGISIDSAKEHMVGVTTYPSTAETSTLSTLSISLISCRQSTKSNKKNIKCLNNIFINP